MADYGLTVAHVIDEALALLKSDVLEN
jgi:hypothetical protein